MRRAARNLSCAASAAPRPKGLRYWLRSGRGSMAVDFVIGTGILITATFAGLDLYRLVDARSAVLRATTMMADYISMETIPARALIRDMARFTYRNQIAMPSQVAVIISALERDAATAAEPDPPTVVQWTEQSLVGDATALGLSELGASCSRISAGGDKPVWQNSLAMEPGENALVVEVCLNLLPDAFFTGGWFAAYAYPTSFYHHKVYPVRGLILPRAPS